MFLEERYEKIIELLEKKGRVTVKELSQAFNVTEDCIRKDLRELENRGNLKRVYGGAMIQRNHSDIKPLDERKNINIDTKRSAALRAVDLIEEGDIIFLDVSTTNLEMAKILNKMDIKVTIVSNMLEIILELRKNPTIRTISIGGEFNKEVGAIVGAAANRYINEFTFDKAFIGVCKKTIISCSNKSYVLMENEKFNYDEFFKFASITDISSIITEQGIINK